jgi:hypothetical protein
MYNNERLKIVDDSQYKYMAFRADCNSAAVSAKTTVSSA